MYFQYVNHSTYEDSKRPRAAAQETQENRCQRWDEMLGAGAYFAWGLL